MKRKIVAGLALTSLIIPNFTFANTNLEIDSANFLASKGIISDKSFSPSDYRLSSSVLRQEIAAVTLGVARMPKYSNFKQHFSDVEKNSPNSWAWQSINALLGYEIISKNSTFRPESKITKAEAIGMIVKAAYNDEYKFDSSKGGTWQSQVVDFAVSKGLTQNFTDYDSFATRGFIFTVAANTLKNNPELANAQPCFYFDKKSKTITGHVLNSNCPTDVVIPKKILGIDVKNIGAESFYYYTPTITSVVFPEGLETIGESAFYGQKLKELKFPSTLLFIENSSYGLGSFANNELYKVEFNDNLKKIGKGAFYNNPNLTEVTISKNTVLISSEGRDPFRNSVNINFK